MELQKQFTEITSLIASAKSRAYQAVNKELVTLYWHVGEYVSKQVISKAWGKSVVQELADYIQKYEPNIKGFSAQNIWRMKQFYETYAENTKLSTLSRELSWSHNMEILSAANSMEEREFYMKLTLKEKLSFRELQRQINSSYYERVMLADAKLSPLSRELPQDLSNTFKDTYVFELLHLPEEHQEKDLQKAISPQHNQVFTGIWQRFCLYG